MAFLAGASNAVLINNCQNLSNLTVQLQVTQDLITLEDTGFSVQLNCYPQIGAITTRSTQGTSFREVVGQPERFNIPDPPNQRQLCDSGPARQDASR